MAFASCLLTGLGAAQSSGPIVADRPTQSAAAFTLPPKTFQIEAGYKFTRAEDDTGNVTDVHALPDALFRIGVWDGIEARLTVGGWDFKSVDRFGVPLRMSGFNDVSLGGKLALLDETGARPGFSILADVSVPVGSKGFTNDYVHPKVLALVSNTLTDRLGLTVNFGPSLVHVDDEIAVDLEYAVALSAAVTSGTALFIEFYGAFGLGEKRLDQHSLQTGITALWGSDLQLDARVGLGFVDNVPTWLMGFGLGWRLFL